MCKYRKLQILVDGEEIGNDVMEGIMEEDEWDLLKSGACVGEWRACTLLPDVRWETVQVFQGFYILLANLKCQNTSWRASYLLRYRKSFAVRTMLPHK